MKFCVSCVYWTLLLIFVVSSGILFLIVASEGIQPPEHSFAFDGYKNSGAQANVTLDDVEAGRLKTSGVPMPVGRVPALAKSNREDRYFKKDTDQVSASFEAPGNADDTGKAKSLEILAESVTQQPNLSQGISETGQAVVLTLVDTATTELQNLAEPKMASELRLQGTAEKNLTTKTERVSEETKRMLPPTPTPSSSPPSVPDAAFSAFAREDAVRRANDTILVEEEIAENDVEEDIVVVVRAERKVDPEDSSKVDLEEVDEEELSMIVGEEVVRIEDGLNEVPELNDSAARARLVGGGPGDDATAAILDGFVASGSSPSDPHEDIPSFSEWAQKRLEEAERKKSTHPNASVQNPGGPGRATGGMKLRSKNYASPDCGAKIVAVNPEARSARSVLASSRDEYMLNTCTSRVWFVVELCEAIQSKKIDLANFELFSSSPKDFSVFVSDRFPTRDWSVVGQFTAKDERDIQSFALQPHLFGKFVKVELHSHYGSEHFCPISLFRVYGTSEFEVLETETENQVREPSADVHEDDNDEDEELLDVDNGEPPRNLFGSARDAVLSIVKKAAEVLVKSGDSISSNVTKFHESIENAIFEDSFASCMTPRYSIVCNNCSEDRFAKVFQLVSCRDRYLDSLVRIDFVRRTLRETNLCTMHGVELGSKRYHEIRAEEKEGEEEEEGEVVVVVVEEEEQQQQQAKGEYYDDTVKSNESSAESNVAMNVRRNFLTSIFTPEDVTALCNVLATKDRQVVLNVSYEVLTDVFENATTRTDNVVVVTRADDVEASELPRVTATCVVNSNSPTCRLSVPLRESRHRIGPFQDSLDNVDPSTPTSLETAATGDGLASQIRPTKTLTREEPRRVSSVPVLESSKDPAEEETVNPEILTTALPLLNDATSTSRIFEEPAAILGTSLETAPHTVTTTFSIENQDGADASGGDADSGEAVSQQSDLVDQDVRMSSQDQLSLDTLLSDLKDLEGEPPSLQNVPVATAASITQAPTSSTPQQKESVFLRLSNRIKALERNMSLSGQYLEELSRRYKKQMEEMQRSLERAVATMGEETRRIEERYSRRLEEVVVLREEIAILSKSVEILLYDRDSWRSRFSTIGQHALLICVEVAIVVLILTYCRRSSDFESEDEAETKEVAETMAIRRRRSIDGIDRRVLSKKTKKRRPSEIASHISGTYRELLIDDDNEDSRRERKRRRKKDSLARITANGVTTVRREVVRRKETLNVIPGGSVMPSRRASSSDATNGPVLSTNDNNYCRNDASTFGRGRRPESAPESTMGWFSDQVERKVLLEVADEERNETRNATILEPRRVELEDPSESNSSSSMTEVDRFRAFASSNEQEIGQSRRTSSSSSSRSGGILKNARLSSPSFMKTALGSRSKRLALASSEPMPHLKSDNWEWYSKHSDQSRSSQESPTSRRILTDTMNNINGNATNGLNHHHHHEDSDESRSSSATSTSGKKEKRGTGLKKMVRKLF